jgi:hypothetical protein
MLGGHFHSGAAIAGFRHHLNVGLRFEKKTQARSKHFMVVGN